MADSRASARCITESMIGQKVGSRVMIAVDATQSSGQWNIVVFDLMSAETIPLTAEGEAVTPPAGLPTVTVENGVPTIATPTGDPADARSWCSRSSRATEPPSPPGRRSPCSTSADLGRTARSSTARGSGAPRSDFAIGAGQLIPGFDEGLVGQTVGSRVLLVIPPDKGYGSTGNSEAGISGTDTLVFVVDILAAALTRRAAAAPHRRTQPVKPPIMFGISGESGPPTGRSAGAASRAALAATDSGVISRSVKPSFTANATRATCPPPTA